MNFWITVTIAYSLIAMVGITLGAELSRRFPGKPRGGPALPDAPAPAAPTFGLDFELGTDFDRALLPGAFPASESERVVQ